MAKTSFAEQYTQKYSADADNWRPLVLRPNAMSTSRYDDVCRLLQCEPTGGRVLDVGCGSGSLLLAMAEQFNELVGIDVTDIRIQAANRAVRDRYPQYQSKVRFMNADADQPFPFKDQYFDVVIICAVLEHVLEVFSVMDQIARVCKKGGCVVVSVPNICYVKHVLGQMLGRVPATGAPTRDIANWRAHGWDGSHLHNFSKSALAQLLENTGFRPEAWTGDGKWAKLRRWCANLVGILTVRARRV